MAFTWPVAAIQVLLGTKGFDTVLLVSDGIAATGMPDGNTAWEISK